MAPHRSTRAQRLRIAPHPRSRTRPARVEVEVIDGAESLGPRTVRGLLYGVPLSLALWTALFWLMA